MNTNRLSLIFSVLALVAALTVGGAYAKQHLIGSKQIRNNSLTTKDIKNDTVGTKDIGEGAVTPGDVSMPPPGTSSPGTIVGPVTDQYRKLGDAGGYTKVQADSVLSVTWSGAVAPGAATNCVFQLRVNGREPVGGGGEVFAQTGAVNVSTTALFSGLPEGPLTVEVWARYSATLNPPAASCIVGPDNPGIKTTFTYNEEVV